MTHGSADYKAAGVDYGALDEGKRQAMARALATSSLLVARGGRALDASRGEPAFVFDFGGRALAFVVEGLGTKSIIARHLLQRHGINRFADVAYDTVAAILNDLCCVGALPLVANAYFATGASEWYAEPSRASALLEGWQRACLDAGCVWGGSPARLWARCRQGALRSSGRSWRRAMRSCWWPPVACTPTAPRSRDCSPSGCLRAT
jgi:phosphoribosylformylglycinamidine cyclo-ligase